MQGMVVGAAAALAASGAFVGHLLGPGSSAAAASRQGGSFGGPVGIRIAHVGQIERDVEPLTRYTLRRVRCSTVPRTASCFVAAR